MKHALLIGLLASFFVANGWAQDRIYRCGNVYTNKVTEAQKHKCKPLAGGNVTVVKSRRMAESTPPVRVASATPTAPSGGNAAQRARDAEARLILESELRKAEARREELAAEYNGGEPERIGSEIRNNQKYLDRVAELKANLDRAENDIVVLRRELARFPGAK